MSIYEKLTFYIEPFEQSSALYIFSLDQCITYLKNLLTEVPFVFISYKDNSDSDIHTALHDSLYHIKHVYLNQEHTIENLTDMCVIYRDKQE
jgi:hypothetical protein